MHFVKSLCLGSLVCAVTTSAALGATVVATNGDDRIHGTSSADTILGMGGDDRIVAGDGNDTIYARDGQKDFISCGSGHDRVIADQIDRVAGNCESVSRG
jgi:Ca2+-binding RTX toxin-like protein